MISFVCVGRACTAGWNRAGYVNKSGGIGVSWVLNIDYHQ